MVTFSTRPKRQNSSSKSRSWVLILNPKTPRTLDGLGCWLSILGVFSFGYDSRTNNWGMSRPASWWGPPTTEAGAPIPPRITVGAPAIGRGTRTTRTRPATCHNWLTLFSWCRRWKRVVRIRVRVNSCWRRFSVLDEKIISMGAMRCPKKHTMVVQQQA